jgi:hypothetical protein
VEGARVGLEALSPAALPTHRAAPTTLLCEAESSAPSLLRTPLSARHCGLPCGLSTAPARVQACDVDGRHPCGVRDGGCPAHSRCFSFALALCAHRCRTPESMASLVCSTSRSAAVTVRAAQRPAASRAAPHRAVAAARPLAARACLSTPLRCSALRSHTASRACACPSLRPRPVPSASHVPTPARGVADTRF